MLPSSIVKTLTSKGVGKGLGIYRQLFIKSLTRPVIK